MAKKTTMKVGDLVITPLKNLRVRLTIGDKSCEADYKDLWGATFMLGDKKYQESMIPVQKKEMMVFSRKHQIQATKDIKAGETINVWCEVNIPQTVVAAIAEENGAKVILQSPSPALGEGAIDASDLAKVGSTTEHGSSTPDGIDPDRTNADEKPPARG